MAVQVALEVEVGEGVAIGDRQKRLERGIRGDVVLVLQVLLLDVVVHPLRHLRAAHQSPHGLHEELAQLGRHLHGALKDGKHTGLGLRALHLLGLGPAAALARILDLLVYTLVQLLHVGHERRQQLTRRVQASRHGLQVSLERGRGASCRRGGRRLLNGGGRHYHGGRRRRRSGRRLRGLLLLGLRLGRSRGNSGRRRYGCRRSDLLLLRDLGGGGGRLGDRGGSGHYTSY